MSAVADLGRTVLNPEVTRVIENYQRLTNDDERAHYADHFIRRTASVMDDIWPIFYELLKRVKDEALYAKPSYTKGEKFDSFDEYFERVAGRPFETWAELESTYQYVTTCKPELLSGKFGAARSAAVAARAEGVAGKTINSGAGPIPKGDNGNPNNIRVTEDGIYGTNVDYLTRRIVRDHPEIAEKMRNGEYRSVRAAALDAGIIHRGFTIPNANNPESIVGTLRRQLDRETLSQVTKLLAEGE